jgi:hypothetical protein
VVQAIKWDASADFAIQDNYASTRPGPENRANRWHPLAPMGNRVQWNVPALTTDGIQLEVEFNQLPNPGPNPETPKLDHHKLQHIRPTSGFPCIYCKTRALWNA